MRIWSDDTITPLLGRRKRGVGEQTDPVVLTDPGPPPVTGSFVCNIGDMLDRMTKGLYRSTPHRVRNAGESGRLSFPFFFDPDFDARIEPIDLPTTVIDDRDERWDRASVHEFAGTYGDYVQGVEGLSGVTPFGSLVLKRAA